MIDNINVNMEKILNNLNKKSILITQEGFLNIQFLIKELHFSINSEILIISDEKSSNYLRVNLNQAYKIQNSDDKLKLYLDNDTIINLSVIK